MKVEFQINLEEKEKELLKQIFNCKKEEELIEQFILYCKASSEEYTGMFLGKKVFTRGSDIREYRLFLLIKNVFKKIPDEQVVSNLFQTSITESRSLIKAVLAKYQYSIIGILDETLKDIICSAEGDTEGIYEINCNSKYIEEELNKILSEISGKLPPIRRKRGALSVYKIESNSYKELKEYFKVS